MFHKTMFHKTNNFNMTHFVDDIPAMQQELKEIICDYCRSTDTIADICCFDSSEAFIAAFVPYSYDIVFMDIYMSGMNGTDTASLMRCSDNRVILCNMDY